MGAIAKRKSENGVVWITLEARQFKSKKVIIPKVKGDGTDLMSIFYANSNHRGKCFKQTTTYVPIFFMLPSILGPIFCDEGWISWELHIMMKSWVDPKDRIVKRPVRPILEWLIWICVKEINEEKSAAETDMSVVTLPSQKLKAWHKLWLDRKIYRWAKAQRVAAPQINVGSEVAASVSMSVSQDKSFFVQGENR